MTGTLAHALAADGRFLPIVDGLDELPEELSAAALNKIDRSSASANGVVITCRPAEYERAVTDRNGTVLSRAAAIEIMRIPEVSVKSYLVSAT